MAASSEVIRVLTDSKEDGEIGLWLYNVPDELREQIRAGEGALTYFVSKPDSSRPQTLHAALFSSDAYVSILDLIVERGYEIAAAEGYSALDHPGFHRMV